MAVWRPRWSRLRPAEAGPAALVLAGMALFVAAVYVVVVRGGGALIGSADSPSLALSVLATAIVAFGFQPVSRRLWPIAVRLARGGRGTPYEILTRFLDDVAGGYATEDVPARMARLLAEATGARYAQVWLYVDGAARPAATWPPDADGPPDPDTEERSPDADADADDGPPDPDATREGRHALPVRHAGEPLGVLVVRERDRQPLTPVEEQLFAGLAAQAGLVLRSVRLRTELALRLAESTEQARELHASRERVVAARDTERRRLERDIHDGAQQHLVALAVNLRLARTLVARSSERAPTALAGLRAAAADAIDTVAGLSRGIYPRPLAEQGLGAALEAVAATAPLRVELAVEPMDRPRPDVEAALYFCCLEALQNAAKHAGATTATIRLGPTADGLVLEISDDGAGFEPAGTGPGSGLVNMRDRAESVGGRLRVDSGPGRGTVVAVHMPAPGGDR